MPTLTGLWVSDLTMCKPPFLGIPPTLRPCRLGKSKAVEMMLTGRTYTATEALQMELVNAVFPDDEFEVCVAGFCADMVTNSWHSLRDYKKLMTETDGMSLNEGLAYEIYNGAGRGPDMEERIAGFGNK